MEPEIATPGTRGLKELIITKIIRGDFKNHESEIDKVYIYPLPEPENQNMRKTPKYLTANGLWNVFTGNKKYNITCGNCSHTYKDKVPFSSGDIASSVCPCCNCQNIWSHSTWEKAYNTTLEPG